jgi:hypothetical protein
MILAIGLWTFLRTSLPIPPPSRLRPSRFAINSRSSSDPLADHAWHGGTESSGSGSQSVRGIGSWVFGRRHAGHRHAHCCAHICPSCGQLPSHPSQ